MYIVYGTDLWPYNQGADFELLNSLFEFGKMIKNADPDKYSYSGYGIEFDARGTFSLSDGSGLVKCNNSWS